MARVSIHILTWNSRTYLEPLLESIAAQTYRDFSVLIIDNASADKTTDWLRENYPQIKLVKNSRNLGYAGGHNQAIHFTKSDYVLMVNPDVVLNETFLEKIVEFMDEHPEAGSAGGKLYKLISRSADLTEESFTRQIDSCGLGGYKSRRFANIGEGEVDNGQFDEIQEVFGVAGTLPCYRREALEDILIDKEYLDTDFNSYKEDIDLAWRLRLRDWPSYFVSQAVAYHRRRASGNEVASLAETLRNRLKKESRINYLSTRNHYWLLAKNEMAVNFWLHAPWIFWYELRKWLAILLFEPRTIKAGIDYFLGLSKMRKKRKIIQAAVRVKPADIRIWFK